MDIDHDLVEHLAEFAYTQVVGVGVRQDMNSLAIHLRGRRIVALLVRYITRLDQYFGFLHAVLGALLDSETVIVHGAIGVVLLQVYITNSAVYSVEAVFVLG